MSEPNSIGLTSENEAALARIDPDEWQLWRIPEEDQAPAAHFEMARQGELELFLMCNEIKLPVDADVFTRFRGSRGGPWLGLTEETKERIRRMDLPALYPQHPNAWLEAMERGRPELPEEGPIDFDPHDLSHCPPHRPGQDDPPNTIAARPLWARPTDSRKSTGIKIDRELLCCFAINADAPRVEIEAAFKDWLKTQRIGTSKGKSKPRSLLAEIALRRLQLLLDDGSEKRNFSLPLRNSFAKEKLIPQGNYRAAARRARDQALGRLKGLKERISENPVK